MKSKNIDFLSDSKQPTREHFTQNNFIKDDSNSMLSYENNTNMSQYFSNTILHLDNLNVFLTKKL